MDFKLFITHHRTDRIRVPHRWKHSSRRLINIAPSYSISDFLHTIV